MSRSFPSQYQLRCSGISLIVSQILMCIAFFLHSIDYDVYNVKNEGDVLTLHERLSSKSQRINIEIAVTLIWISYPLLLISLYGIKQYMISIFLQNDPVLILVYLMEKSYLMFMVVIMIILPALSLSAISYDWSFNETTVGDLVPSGYYIQTFIILYEFELVDCAAVADATFMISILLAGAIINYRAIRGNKIFQQYLSIFTPGNIAIKHIIYLMSCINYLFSLTLVIAFLIVLFQFAESGFFSIGGYAKFMVIWVSICKMFIGCSLIHTGSSSRYHKMKQLLNSDT